MKRLLVVVVLACSGMLEAVGAEELPDREFVAKHVLPAVNLFLERAGDSLKKISLDTTNATRTRMLRFDDVGERIMWEIYLKNSHLLWAQIDGTNVRVKNFISIPSPANQAMRSTNAVAARYYAGLTNHFTWDTAVAFGWSFLQRTGTDTNNFKLRLEESSQMKWWEGTEEPEDDPNAVTLPFYDLVWWRKDLTSVPAQEPIYPHIQMTIDGTTKRVLYYYRFYLPVVGDFGAWRPDLKQTTNAPAK